MTIKGSCIYISRILLTYVSINGIVYIIKLDRQARIPITGVIMTKNKIKEFTSLYAYNRAQGLQHVRALHVTHDRIVMKYAFMTQAALMASLLVSCAIVLLTPWFAHASGMERIHALGWFMVGGMVLSAYFPFKAKSGALWSIYGVIAALVAVLVLL